MIRVAIVDDQQLVRAGFALVINSQSDMEVLVEAGDGREAIAKLTTLPCDVVLMDVRMPVMDGLEATAKLSQLSPQTKVIILTTFDVDEYVLAAVRAGASGFLLKDAPPEDMLQAIRTVNSGDAVIAPSSTKRLLAHVAHMLPAEAGDAIERVDQLTTREREVLIEMAHGYSNTEIASRLSVSEATIKTHVGRVLAKLQARDRVQAVITAYETGLVSP
ncbi:MAG: response regulator transcription factor, partial [Bowdeniella nasicola]|nr:response regulator transcription factor [Bowdeniella nasicola]